MTEYVNKEYYNRIKGNCAYIDLSPGNIHQVMDRLNAEGIMFSATYGGYRNTVTVSKADAQRAYAIAAEYKTQQQKRQRIIGNTEYANIRDRIFINTDPQTALQLANLLSGDTSIRFSGRILENSATITVSGRKNAEMVNRMIENIHNADLINELYKAGFERLADTNGFVNIRNNKTGETVGFRDMGMVRAMFHDESSEFFHPSAYRVDSIPEEDMPYYISEIDSTSSDERNVYADENVTVPVFESAENAEQYAQEKGIDLSGFEEVGSISEPEEIPKEDVPVEHQVGSPKENVPVEHREETLEPTADNLSIKLSAEYEEYISDLKSRSPDEIVSSAYEITVKNNIRTYAENEDIDLTEEQLAALVAMDNVLNEIYWEWNKNEFANGYDDVLSVMRARADRIINSRQRENVPIENIPTESVPAENVPPEPVEEKQETDEIAEALDLKNNSITFTVVTFDDSERFVVPNYVDIQDVADLDEYREYIESSGAEEVHAETEFYIVGSTDRESQNASDKELKFIREHLDDVLRHKMTDSLEYNSGDIPTPEELLEDDREDEQLEKAKKYISDYLEKTFGALDDDFRDPHYISAGYTELGDNNEYACQVYIDIIDLEIKYVIDNNLIKTDKYDSIEQMSENALSALDFDEFISDFQEMVDKMEDERFRLTIPELNIDVDMREIDSIEIKTSDDKLTFYYSKINNDIESFRESDDNTNSIVDIDEVSSDILNMQSMGHNAVINELGKKKDAKIFDVADHISSIIWNMNRAFELVPVVNGQPNSLVLAKNHDAWAGYESGKNEYDNTMDALFKGNYSVVENYLENVRDSDDVSNELREMAGELLNDVALFKDISGIAEINSKAAEILSKKFTAYQEGKFAAEEFYNSNSPDVSELADHIKNLVLNERQGIGLMDYAAGENGITFADLTEYSWLQTAQALSMAIENGTYISEDERAKRANSPRYSIYQVNTVENAKDVPVEHFNEAEITGSFGFPIDETGKAFEMENARTDYGVKAENAIPEKMPLYTKSLREAKELGETEMFTESRRLNSECADDIDKAMTDNYNNNIIDSEQALKDILEKYDFERVEFIVATRVSELDYDGRVSSENKAWAKDFLEKINFQGSSERFDIRTHPGLLNYLVDSIRKEEQQRTQEQQQKQDRGYVSMSKVGDFWEFYGKNARIAADILGLRLSQKNGNDMCGFPDFKKDENSQKLRDAGYTVLIEEVFELNARNVPPQERQEEKVIEQDNAQTYEPELGDRFRDSAGVEWKLTSLTGVMPWYTDQCALTSVNGSIEITKNEDYSDLLDTSKYTFIGKEPETEKTEYTPKIGDRVEIDGTDFSISDINGTMLTLTEADTLFGNSRYMALNDFFSSNYTVIEENGYAKENVPAENVPPKNVPVEHQEDTEKQTSQNYVITDDDFGVKTPKARFAANIEAIKTLRKIESANRNLVADMFLPRKATPEEQEKLAGYTGWGAIPQAFDPRSQDWSKEYSELKELLTDEEYSAARRSTMNAHFTSPVVINAIYQGLSNLGFEKGKVLEPAMGIGNFFGAMPEQMRESELHGVELDSITGRIAQQLYPDADIQVKGFEKTNFANDSFDAVVGNVPFGDYKLSDKEYDKHKFMIHDYFIAKSIDKLRPGGVLAVVTSKGTMDKENADMRKYIAQRAELLGAIRLPNNAFKANAGTEVTSDILFFQKRERPIEIDPDEVEWIGKAENPDGFSINKYFVNHPEMIMGKIAEGNKLYGTQANETSCIPIEGADLKTQLAEAVKNIQGTYTPKTRAADKKKEAEEIIPAPANSRKFSYYAVDNSLYYRRDDENMTKVNMSADSLKRALAMVEMRDTIRELLDLQLNNADGTLNGNISVMREELNQQYDAFVGKFGHFDDTKNRRAFKGDDGYNFLTALEIQDKTTGEFEKTDIFYHDTVKPNNVVTHVDTAQEALILSVAEKAKVDFDYMTELCGMDKDTLINELEGQIFRLPQETEKYVTADEYLTGNIRVKLRELENAPDGMDVSRHREALEAAMPQKVEAKDISVKLGAHWVDPKFVTQFINDKFRPGWNSYVQAQYSKASGKWKIEGMKKSDKESYTAVHDYGTKRRNAYAILEGILNHEDLTVKDPKLDENGEPMRDSRDNIIKVTNHEETKAVQIAVKKIESEWEDWIFKDPERRTELVDKYNEVFNSIRQREYDGSHLRFVGMNSEIQLKEHQKNAVARALYGGNTLLAHCVGAGKTYEMITIAMEGKRLGLHNKSLFAVPNALTEQMGNDFKKLYPGANILVATKKDFEPKNRKELFAKIATGEWDAVIVGHSQFDRMGLSQERAEKYLKAEIESLREELENARNTDGAKSFSVKEIEKTIARYEKKIKDGQDKVAKDEYIDFEQMGFDKIFVDECHMYKNLGTATKMSNVAGIGTTGSGKAAELLIKTKYMDEITGGRGTTFASGTPISNSMTELYTMMRYLQASLLEQCNISHFDEWAADFGTVKTDYELKPESDGKYQLKTRFAQFNNLPELMGMFKEAADIRTADTLDLEKPLAHVHEVVAQPSKIQKRLIKSLSKRASKIRAGGVDPRDDNMLSIVRC